jgi:hypothetical protein
MSMTLRNFQICQEKEIKYFKNIEKHACCLQEQKFFSLGVRNVNI